MPDLTPEERLAAVIANPGAVLRREDGWTDAQWAMKAVLATLAPPAGNGLWDQMCVEVQKLAQPGCEAAVVAMLNQGYSLGLGAGHHQGQVYAADKIVKHADRFPATGRAPQHAYRRHFLTAARVASPDLTWAQVREALTTAAWCTTSEPAEPQNQDKP